MVPLSNLPPPTQNVTNYNLDQLLNSAQGSVVRTVRDNLGLGDHLQGRGLRPVLGLGMGMHVEYDSLVNARITPSAPSSLLFSPFAATSPSSSKSSTPPPASLSSVSFASAFSISSLSIPSSQSVPFSSHFPISSSLITSVSLAPPHSASDSDKFDLAYYNAGVLDLSYAYRYLAKSYYLGKLGFAKFSQTIFSDRTDLMRDLLKDCEGGPSVFWDSLRLGESASKVSNPATSGSSILSGFGSVDSSSSLSCSVPRAAPGIALGSSYQIPLPFSLTPVSLSQGSLPPPTNFPPCNPVPSSVAALGRGLDIRSSAADSVRSQVLYPPVSAIASSSSSSFPPPYFLLYISPMLPYGYIR